eukprot:TRINITY_DN21141_c0_g1_i1.p1 TRINITY_DN21141_c0_g1~~TRINITY_DN21141_c0_g1_i1.p1  ORF type:complete len:833 (+),score=102.09 TRINITY_DN21141_c0_g1_i1:387-2885(+)
MVVFAAVMSNSSIESVSEGDVGDLEYSNEVAEFLGIGSGAKAVAGQPEWRSEPDIRLGKGNDDLSPPAGGMTSSAPAGNKKKPGVLKAATTPVTKPKFKNMLYGLVGGKSSSRTPSEASNSSLNLHPSVPPPGIQQPVDNRRLVSHAIKEAVRPASSDSPRRITSNISPARRASSGEVSDEMRANSSTNRSPGAGVRMDMSPEAVRPQGGSVRASAGQMSLDVMPFDRKEEPVISIEQLSSALSDWSIPSVTSPPCSTSNLQSGYLSSQRSLVDSTEGSYKETSFEQKAGVIGQHNVEKKVAKEPSGPSRLLLEDDSAIDQEANGSTVASAIGNTALPQSYRMTDQRPTLNVSSPRSASSAHSLLSPDEAARRRSLDKSPFRVTPTESPRPSAGQGSHPIGPDAAQQRNLQPSASEGGVAVREGVPLGMQRFASGLDGQLAHDVMSTPRHPPQTPLGPNQGRPSFGEGRGNVSHNSSLGSARGMTATGSIELSREAFMALPVLNPDDKEVFSVIRLAVEQHNFSAAVTMLEDETINAEQKYALAAGMRELMKGPGESADRRVQFARAGGLIPLFRMLDAEDTRTVEHVAAALLNVSLTDAPRAELMAIEDFVPRMVALIRHESMEVKETAAATLFSVSDTMERRQRVGEAGAVPLLLEMFVSKTMSVRGRKDAALALFSLSLHPVCRKTIVDEGGVAAMLQVMAEDDKMEAKIVAILVNLVKAPEGCEALLRVPDICIDIGEVVESGSMRAKEDAAGILVAMARASEDARRTIEHEYMFSIKMLAQSGSKRGKAKALELLQVLTGASLNSPNSTMASSRSYSSDSPMVFDQL